MKRISLLVRLTFCFMLIMPFTSTRAQSIDFASEEVAVHLHPQEDIIGVTNGVYFQTYTLDFEFIDEFSLIDDTTIKPIRYPFQWSPDGSKLAVRLFGVGVPPLDGVLQIWDMATSQKLYELPAVDLFAGVAWSPDSSRFAASIFVSLNEWVTRVFDVESGEILTEIEAGQILQLAWSPIGNQLIFDQLSGVQIWSADTGQKLRTLEAVMGGNGQLAFSSTENLVAFVNLENDGSILEIWNTDTGEFVHQLKGHTHFISRFHWGLGGLVTSGLDDTIRIWDTETGQQLHSFKVGRYPTAQLNADGTVLLVQDRLTGIHTRDAETGEILDVFSEPIKP